MFALVNLSAEWHQAIIKTIFKEFLVVGNRHGSTGARKQTKPIYSAADFVDRILTGRIQLESFAHENRFDRVNSDGVVIAVIQVTDGCAVWPTAVSELLPVTAFDVFRKIVDVVFALTECDIEHELSVRGGLKAKGGESQILDFSSIHEIHDSAPIHAIARQSVGMPCEDPLSFTFFEFAQHHIELRTPRLLCGAAFFKNLDDIQLFPFGELMQFKKLGLNGKDLAVAFIGGFADVNEKIKRLVFHGFIISHMPERYSIKLALR